ncbi:hypothetical protein Slala01_63530 [Streptomyces lavendulae subsp. lavendulae]|nr:hypothetical protein Slala01_63530 [Streptomyces lavendulae subsp. lavendulae]
MPLAGSRPTARGESQEQEDQRPGRGGRCRPPQRDGPQDIDGTPYEKEPEECSPSSQKDGCLAVSPADLQIVLCDEFSRQNHHVVRVRDMVFGPGSQMGEARR